MARCDLRFASVEDVAFLPAVELVSRLEARELSSRELLEIYLARLAKHNGPLNAVVTVDADRARAAADAADTAVAKGEPVGPLHGLPMTVKDQFPTAGMRTTIGMREFAEWLPDYDALPVARLRAAGAVIFGKSNMPYAGIDVQTDNRVFGRTNNPWDVGRTPGGSSGGSAAAVAAGLTGLELGGDIGGSVRTPAHYCGVFGLKPSYRVIADPRDPRRKPGFRTELDIATPGPLARSAQDLDLAMSVLAGPDPSEAVGWHLDLPAPRHDRLADYRIAAWLDDADCPTEPDVHEVLRAAVTAWRAAGANIDEQARPAFRLVDSFRDYQRLLYATLCHGLPFASAPGARFLAPVGASFPGDSQLARFATGATLRHGDWLLANEARQDYRRAWAQFFRDYDVLLCPATPCTAPRHNRRFGNAIVLRRMPSHRTRSRPYMDQLIWAGAVGMAYLPAVVAPTGITPEGLPVGIQIVGPYLEDRTAIHVAEQLTATAGGFTRPPGY
jgi:amidase